MRTFVSSLIGACTLIALPAQAADWSDTYLGYRHGSSFQEPGCNQDITKDIVSLTHASGYKYGSNFFNVDVLRSASGKTEVGADSAHSKVYDNINGTTDGTGAQELYLVYSHTLSFGKVTGSKIAFGPVSDIGFVTGFDFNSKNTAFSPKVMKYYAGPKFSFDISKGFLDLSFLYIKEKNNNSVINNYFDGANNNAYGTGRSVTFDGTYRIAIAGSKAIGLGPVDTNIKGFANYTGAKGKDGFGADTKPETLVELAWMFDIGKTVGHPGALYVGPGFQYWSNKFGNKNVDEGTLSPFAQNRKTTAFQIEAEIHF